MLCSDRGSASSLIRIDVIGGGPAGLTLAILAKKHFPAAAIDVVERDAAARPPKP